MKLRIDYKEVEATEGMTIMQAAAQLGICIPALCYRKGIAHHPSCMVCMVKDLDSGNLLASCAYPVREGMNIQTHSREIHDARREALELLLSDHVGDCEAPCRRSCPAFMNIPEMNRHIAAGRFREALQVVREEIALPLILGYICPAPCEKACHRSSIDGAVSICLLKRFTADDVSRLYSGLLPSIERSGRKVAVIGTGPAGLSAAYYLLSRGHMAVLYDRNSLAGGLLRYDISEDKLPRKALDSEIEAIRMTGAEFRMNTNVTKEFFETVLIKEYDAVIIATGADDARIAEEFGLEQDEHGLHVSRATLETHSTIHGSRITTHGIFAAGNVISKHKMAVRSVAQGKAAALSADHFLKTGKAGGLHHMFNSSFGRLREEEFEEYLKESSPAKRVTPMKGFEGGFSEREAMKEAARCMDCDCRKLVNCKLRIFATEYQAKQKRFAGPERRLITRALQHEFVVYETEKCIRCGICVEITRAAGELKGLSYVGRGFDVRISVPLGGDMKDALVKTGKQVAEACPTGALSYKTTYHEKNRDT